MRFACLLATLCLPLLAHAQADDPLAVTLPSGKVLHFQTEEQKAKYLAAKERLASGSPAPAPATEAVRPTPAPMGSAAMNEQPAMSGKVNVNAPTFTADYYMLAPETWEGKQITLSVAYLKPKDAEARADGMRELRAATWGVYQNRYHHHRSGGDLTILATPAAAERISMLAGSTLEYDGTGVKLTLIKGKFTQIKDGSKGTAKYGLIVTE